MLLQNELFDKDAHLWYDNYTMLGPTSHAGMRVAPSRPPIITRSVFGNITDHSTTLALIYVVEDIYQHLYNNEIYIGIYLDLKKVFW